MAARCVVLKNHKKRSAEYRIKYSFSPFGVLSNTKAISSKQYSSKGVKQ
jgi:hypothetical protein